MSISYAIIQCVDIFFFLMTGFTYIILSVFILVASIDTSFLFTAIVQIYHILLIHCSINRDTCSFHILATMSGVVVLLLLFFGCSVMCV